MRNMSSTVKKKRWSASGANNYSRKSFTTIILTISARSTPFGVSGETELLRGKMRICMTVSDILLIDKKI